MIKKTITYENLDGEELTEDFYFSLSKAELAEMELRKDGGMEAYLTRIIAAQDGATIISTFKEILLASVGKRSEDGKSFVKTPEYASWFLGTDAYSVLFVELVSDMEASAEFINGVVPKALSDKLKTVDVQLPQADVPQTDVPVWELEDRDPTPQEIRSMSHAELARAMQRRAIRPTSGG